MRVQLMVVAMLGATLAIVASGTGCEEAARRSVGQPIPGENLGDASDPIHFADELVEASCGQCQFGMDGSGCDLAIRVGDESWYVDGTSIDDHGDAHSADGMCNCVRRARVTGHVENGRFVCTAFELLPKSSEPK